MKNDAPTVVTIDTRTLARFLLLVLLTALLYVLRDIMLVLLTSIVVASLVESVVLKMRERNIPRGVTVFSVYIITFIATVGLFYLFVPVFISEISSLVGALGNYIPTGSILNNLHGATVDHTKTLVSNISGNVPIADLLKSAQNLVLGVSGGFIQTSSVVFGGILNLILIIVISFYLSMQERGIENFLRIITPDKQEPYVISLWQRTERKIGKWLQGQLVLGLLVGILIYLGLAILGVEYALTVAVLAAVCELIPFGLIFAMIPALGFAYVTGGVILAFKALVVYAIVQACEVYILNPAVVKKVVGISPLVVVLSILIGAKLAGFWGVILAIPVAVCMLEYFSDLEKRKIPM